MTNNPHKTVFGTWLVMLTVQTIGSVDSKRKLPAPKQYVAIGVLWGILFLLTDLGAGKFAARLSLLVLLTASIFGPFGTRMVQFLEMVSRRFAVAPGSGGFAGTAGTAPPAGPAGPATSIYPQAKNA